MSFSPSISSVRLQELKLWQGSYENLLKKPGEDVSKNTTTISNAAEWDLKRIQQTKPFDQLLEEKLAEDLPVVVSSTIKRPFLKKGHGLARFKMAPRNVKTKKTVTQPVTPKKGILKKPYKDVDFSPLVIPDFVKPRGTWKQVFENHSEDDRESLENYEEFRNSLTSNDGIELKSSSNQSVIEANKSKFDEIRGDALKSVENLGISNNCGLIRNDVPKKVADVGDFTLEELKMEHELKAFEALERRIDQTSFCSTNTSVVNLVSTPRKETGANLNVIDSSMLDSIIPESIQKKLVQVSNKTEVLQHFLFNLQQFKLINNKDAVSETEIEKSEASTSPDSSFSDENSRWTTVTDTATECETAFENQKVNIGTNTSFDSKYDESLKDCQECDRLKSMHIECKTTISKLRTENTKLNFEIREVQRDCLKLRKEKENEFDMFQDRIETLEKELTSERKRFAKEKGFFENYVKEAQNRPSKKEREEIMNMKQELAELKELLKCKETRNGSIQARLRTQIKQQQKDVIELKNTVDKLQKENGKLLANQKYARRPQEVKMLQEIKQNLSKLTENTLKSERKTPSPKKKSLEEKENEIRSSKSCEITQKDNNSQSMSNAVSESGLSRNSASIEEEYETVFGQPMNITSLDKTERILPDGGVEILYANKHMKTISADGKLIKLKYSNGDIKETNLNDQTISYYYTREGSHHIQFPDGSEKVEFENGNKYIKYPNKRIEVTYPDGLVHIINPDGTEEQTFPDGTKTIKNSNGEQIILLPNGQREVHTDDYKKREYPDGTVRTLHKDGTVETVYANGRVRLKNANGVLIMDTHQV